MGLQGLRASFSKDEKLSKSGHKFEKKLQFYSKVRETVASLSAKKTIAKKKKLRSRQKKLKAYDLSSLGEYVPESKAPRQAAVSSGRKLNFKKRQKLIEMESKQCMAVINHPAFKADPLVAIHQHLQNTMPIEEPEKKSSRTEKKKKGKKSKASSRPEAMDI